MTRQPKFKNGQRVILKGHLPGEGYPDGPPEERGVVEWDDDWDKVPEDPTWPIMYVVRVDPEYIEPPEDDHFDDGLREVSEDQMEAEREVN